MKKWKWLALIAVLLIAAPAMVGLAQYLGERFASPVDENTRLNVRRAGDGPRILVLHGLAGSGRYFTERASELGPFTFVAPDLLGFGDSPKPSGPYSLAQHVALVEQELEREGVSEAEPVMVVGHSFGTLVALELARQRPKLIDSVIVVSVPIFSDREDAARLLAADSPMAAAVARRDATAQVACMFHALYRVPQLAPMFNVPEDVFLDATKHSWTSLAGTLDDAILDTDVAALAKGVKQPLVFAHGERDATALFPRAKVLAESIGAPMLAHPSGGHQVILEDPAWLAEIIKTRQALRVR